MNTSKRGLSDCDRRMAGGVIFATLEDEPGIANNVVWSHVFEGYRHALLASRLLMVHGKLQKEGCVIHVIADRLIDLSAELSLLSSDAGATCENLSRADEAKRQSPDPVRMPPRRHPRNMEVMPKSRDFH